MSLDDLVREIAKLFPVQMTGRRSVRSQTGEEYVIVGEQEGGGPSKIPGTRLQGCFAASYGTPDAACLAAFSAFSAYAEGRSGTLYWRKPPEMLEGPDDLRHKRRYRVYLRLLISDQPRLPEEDLV